MVAASEAEALFVRALPPTGHQDFVACAGFSALGLSGTESISANEGRFMEDSSVSHDSTDRMVAIRRSLTPSGMTMVIDRAAVMSLMRGTASTSLSALVVRGSHGGRLYSVELLAFPNNFVGGGEGQGSPKRRLCAIDVSKILLRRSLSISARLSCLISRLYVICPRPLSEDVDLRERNAES